MTTMHSLVPLNYEESAARRMLDLVERHCPRLMRCGGGGLTRTTHEVGKQGRAMPEAAKVRALALGREGRLNATQIGRLLGHSQSSICKLLKRHGITPAKGRRNPSAAIEAARGNT